MGTYAINNKQSPQKLAGWKKHFEKGKGKVKGMLTVLKTNGLLHNFP